MKESALVETYYTYPFTLKKGEGAWVWDTEGTRYLDLYGGHAVSLLGHSPSEIVEAITRQASELLFYSNLAPMKVREEAASLLASYAPEELNRVFFCNSGAEANENALKLSIQLSGRKNLVSLKGGWHGRTLLCSAVTDDPKWHSSLSGWTHSCTWITPNVESELEKISGDVAAVIVEPIQSIAGVIELNFEYLRKIRERCDKVGAFLIFDEIQTGLGRTGLPFVSGYSGTLPDFMTLAKGLGGGVPVGALVMKENIASQLKIGDLGSTFGGAPISMAAVSAVLKILLIEKLEVHAKAIGDYARMMIPKASKLVKSVKGRGCLLGLETRFPAKELQENLLKEKVITGTSGDPNVIRLLPPLIIEKEHIDQLCSALETLEGASS